MSESRMSFMFEVLYARPVNKCRETRITETAANHGGELTYREEPADLSTSGAISLTIEFRGWTEAELAAAELRAQGEHVEGPMVYGND
jgi:hypothetical protein